MYTPPSYTSVLFLASGIVLAVALSTLLILKRKHIYPEIRRVQLASLVSIDTDSELNWGREKISVVWLGSCMSKISVSKSVNIVEDQSDLHAF